MDNRKGTIPGFGKRLQHARKRSPLSTDQVLQQLGIVRSTLSNWENDTHMPDPPTVVALATMFNVSVDYLYGKENETALLTEKGLDEEQLRALNEIIRLFRKQPSNEQDEI